MMNPEAEELNRLILKNSKTVSELLSQRGNEIFFPKKGILSQSAEAKGKRINATIGTALENDGTPMRLQSIAKNILLNPDAAFSYAPSYGRPDFRERWKIMLSEKNPSLKGKEFSLPVVTSALTHGLSMLGYLLVDKNDTVLLPDLYWENYDLVFRNAYGGKLSYYSLFRKGCLDLGSFRKKVNGKNPGKRIVLLNFPNNPSGYTSTIEEAKQIVNILKEAAIAGNKIAVIIDDAYYGLVYEEGIEKESLFSWLCDCHENLLAIKVDGPTKEDYVWGFRTGFLTYGIKGGSKELYTAIEAKTAGAIRGNISNAANLSQSLLLKAYTSETYTQEKAEKFGILKRRYESVKKALEGRKHKKYFKALPYNSGYFMCVETKKGIDAEKVRQLLLLKYDTGVIASGNLIRIAFSAIQTDKIPALFENLINACGEVAQ